MMNMLFKYVKLHNKISKQYLFPLIRLCIVVEIVLTLLKLFFKQELLSVNTAFLLIKIWFPLVLFVHMERLPLDVNGLTFFRATRKKAYYTSVIYIFMLSIIFTLFFIIFFCVERYILFILNTSSFEYYRVFIDKGKVLGLISLFLFTFILFLAEGTFFNTMSMTNSYIKLAAAAVIIVLLKFNVFKLVLESTNGNLVLAFGLALAIIFIFILLGSKLIKKKDI